MAFVYLIGQADTENTFKIGSTRQKDIQKRLKQLQTGNSEPLYLKDYFETATPFKLEKMLHMHFREKQNINEWYDLTKEEIREFKHTCQTYQTNINALKDNPFFKMN